MCEKHNIQLKVCGLMNAEDVDLCVSLGVTRLGFVTQFPVPVPWNITVEKAAELVRRVPEGISTVMVTGGTSETILNYAKAVRPSMVQIRYGESVEDMTNLVGNLTNLGIKVIGKYPVSPKTQEELFQTTDPFEIARIFEKSGVDEILIDPRSKDNAASRNLVADTDLVRTVNDVSNIPVILAGGITPDNMLQKMQECGVNSVDVMNGSEIEPGRKSADKIRELIRLCQ